jgi:hypothetical protein
MLKFVFVPGVAQVGAVVLEHRPASTKLKSAGKAKPIRGSAYML